MSNSHRVSPEVTVKHENQPKLPALTPKAPAQLKSARSVANQLGHDTLDAKKKRIRDPATVAFENYSPFRKKCAAVLDARWYTVLMLFITIYALFGDDIRLSVTQISADTGFFTMATICLVLFVLEFTISCYCKPGYLFSFYFVLDLIATFSVLPDIGWIWEAIIGSDGNQSASALKASKATRAGSKAGRIVRVVRAVRLFRVVKILKWKHKDEDAPIQTEVKESKVGSKMGEVTVQRVVILVLFLVMLLPVFDGGYTEVEYRYQEAGLRALHIVITAGLGTVNSIEFERLFQGYIRDAGVLVYMELATMKQEDLVTRLNNIRFQPADSPGEEYTLTVNPENEWSAAMLLPDYATVMSTLRDSEMNTVRAQGCFNSSFIVTDAADETSSCISLAVFDITSTAKEDAAYNILKTCFIIVVLVSASTAFIRTTSKLVLQPIERMMYTVQRLAENPLASVQSTANEAEIRKNAREQGFETALLELTLAKVGTLMQVGFGAAGADIIGKNMGSGDLDPMLPGKKITAIYGFCDIRQFTDTTECLQEEVMVYVNKLGHIMHSGTHHYYGMANKNVGDAFLLSWKICDGELPCFARFTDCPTEEDRLQVEQGVRCPPNQGAGTKLRRITPTEMADSALTAFIKCLIDLDNANTDGPLTEYLVRDNVVKRFGPGFRIKMGFGMHVGWAVEGAIGSRFKIDATYISPHVEMADRLEAGSKIFGTPINISHWFAALLSPGARKFLRKMDRISIRGVDTPLTVYTFDVTVMKKGFGTPKIDPATGMQQPVDFENDPEYMEIREGLEPAFLESAASGVEAYISGDWPKARHYLTHAQQIRPNDGPCKHLLGALKEHNFEAPPDWKGYRFIGGY